MSTIWGAYHITENRFFLDIYTCNRNDRKNGTIERIVGDMVILCNYPDQFKKDAKLEFKWLNENGTMYDFGSLNDLLTRMTASVETTKEIRTLFNNKNASVLVAEFKAFTETGKQHSEKYGLSVNGQPYTKEVRI